MEMDRRQLFTQAAFWGGFHSGKTRTGNSFPKPEKGQQALMELGFLPMETPAETSGVRRLSAEKSFVLYHAHLSPAYTVKPGEVVRVECRHGLPGLVTRSGSFREPGPNDPINPATGPIFVEQVESGDGLAIDFLEIRPGDWGYCNRHVFELKDGFIHLEDRIALPVQPMIGGVGIAPAQGTMDTKTPTDTGGNMDCREVRTGSTLLFTAQVRGGLVGLGDPHALQGDGEISGQGMETDAEVLVRFRKLRGAFSPRPVIVRPEFVATIAAHADLTEATWQATDDMVRLLARTTDLEEKIARWTVNFLGSLKINQIVDPAKGVRMEMPSWIFCLPRKVLKDSFGRGGNPAGVPLIHSPQRADLFNNENPIGPAK
jgi:amidase